MLYKRNSTAELQNTLPFGETRTSYEITDLDGTLFTPTIHANVTGFFRSDEEWTSYRRSYFSVTASYSLSADTNSKILFLRLLSHSTPATILSFALCVGAVDSEYGNEIGILQYTSKTEKGRIAPPPTMTELFPRPLLDMDSLQATSSEQCSSGNDSEDKRLELFNYQGQSVAFFDRMKFKKATANKGKRREAQQYFR